MEMRIDWVGGDSGPWRGVTAMWGLFLGGILVVLPCAVSGSEVPLERTVLDSGFGRVGAVATGDLDGDSRDDVVAAFATAGEVRWWSSSHVFLFGEGAITTGLSGASSVALGDVDGDGDLDVVAAGPDVDTVRWCENDFGDGSVWSDHSIAAAALGVSSIAVADLDRDGDLDVVGAVTGANLVRWWENDNGAGSSWSPHLVSGSKTGVIDVAVADLDRDGDADVLAAVPGLDTIGWWRNNGSGGGWGVNYSDSVLGASTVAAGDLDDDGDLDLVAGGTGEDAVLWWENTAGDGSSYTRRTLVPSLTDPVDLAVADLDQDGDDDLLAAGSDDAGWWENNEGDGTSWELRDLVSVHRDGRIVAADVVGSDGFLDVVVSTTHSGGFLEAHHNRRVHESAYYPTEVVIDLAGTVLGGQQDWAVGDVDRDGLDDLVVVDDNLTRDVAWLMLGSRGYREIIEIEAVESVALGDLDRDGDLDLVYAISLLSAGYIGWLDNVDGALVTLVSGGTIDPQNDGDDYWFRQLRTADMDGDGDLDVLAAGNDIGAGHLVAWWENDPATLALAWPQHTIATDLRHTVEAVDLDGDGDLDVVAGDEGGRDIAWYENLDGSATSWSGPRVIDADGAWRIAVGDLDGDGDADVAGATVIVNLGFTAGFRWWENRLDEGGAFEWFRRELDEADARDVAVADLDGDGDLDLLAAAGDDGGWWYRNDGFDTFTRVDVPLGYPGERVVGLDFEGDGAIDYVQLDQNLRLQEFRNMGGAAAVHSESLAPAFVAQAVEEPLFVLDVFHRGRTLDPAVELARLELHFQADGASAEVEVLGGLLEALRLRYDDGDGVYDPTVDVEIASIDLESARLTSGDPGALAPGKGAPGSVGFLQWILPDDTSELQHGAAATPQRYFLTIELKPDAEDQGVDELRVRLFSDDSACENADYDLPVALEISPESVATFTIGAPLFADGFESGDTTAWSSSAP